MLGSQAPLQWLQPAKLQTPSKPWAERGWRGSQAGRLCAPGAGVGGERIHERKAVLRAGDMWHAYDLYMICHNHNLELGTLRCTQLE
jgi:hypothetical protein